MKQTMKKAIEEYFPIVDINRLAMPERNAFKPIYTMHKWFARRSSSVFRAILLGAMKPAGTDIMEEFYKDHTNDPDTKGMVVLDPFMGGGTTIVEALRLGCKVVGIDLNPVAWFIVKTEVEPVDLDELKSAFERLSERIVPWSGKPLKETLLDLYKTECPCCGNKEADTIYTFWVKYAPCTTATCSNETPLFNDYIVSQKSPSIKYYPDCNCPKCRKTFDYEVESASMVGDASLMINATQFSAGTGRESKRWVYGLPGKLVECPWCSEVITPEGIHKKPAKKKVQLNVLYCPHCEEVWQYRGEIRSDDVVCPTCKNPYNPNIGNIPTKGKFTCQGTCNGNVDNIISAIRKLPENQPLPARQYAIEGYCSICAGDTLEETEDIDGLFGNTIIAKNKKTPAGTSLLSKNNGKFFKRYSSKDLQKYLEAKSIWEKEKINLPYPKSEIPLGAETGRLLEHHYKYWHQMFNERQLLSLSTLLVEIGKEQNTNLKEMLLTAFFSALETSNLFTRYHSTRFLSAGIFARHDYQPKVTICENNVWGTKYGNQTYRNTFQKVIDGKAFAQNPIDSKYENGVYSSVTSEESLVNTNIAGKFSINSQSSSNLISLGISDVDFVITDPPYAGNVNYSELADFFYVWLRLILMNKYPQFQPEYTPKVEEVVENKTRGKSAKDFQDGLTKVFQECFRISKPEAPLIFTFHHAEDSAWESLLNSVCDAGYYLEAVIPIHGEAENSLHLMNNEAISYDLIHICKKRQEETTARNRSWAGIRQEVRQRAREEIKMIEGGRYGEGALAPSDINIILIGKCLELYSKHYGSIVDYENKPLPLHEALKEIKMMVDQLVTKATPLPSELESIDVPSYIYFTTLYDKKEIKVDEVSKSVRGIIDPQELKNYGLIINRRESGSRTYYVKQPNERLNDLLQKLEKDSSEYQSGLFEEYNQVLSKDILMIDVVYVLLGLAETGNNLLPWLERFGGLKPQIRAAMEFFIQKDKHSESAKRVLRLMDKRTFFTKE